MLQMWPGTMSTVAPDSASSSGPCKVRIFPRYLQGVAVGGPKKALDSAVLALLSYLTGGRKGAIPTEVAFDRIERSSWQGTVGNYWQFRATLGRLRRVGAIHFSGESVWVSHRYWDAAERKGRGVRLLHSDFMSMRPMEALACGLVRWRTRLKDWADSERWMAKALRISRWTFRVLLAALEAGGHVIRGCKVLLGKVYHVFRRKVARTEDPRPTTVEGSSTPNLRPTEIPELLQQSLDGLKPASVCVSVLERRLYTEHILRSHGLWDSDSPPVSGRRAQIARRLDMHGWTPDAVDSVLAGIARDPSVRDPKRFAASLLARGCEFSRWLDQGSHVDDRRVTGLLDGLLRSLAVTLPRDPVPCHAARSYPGGVNSPFKAPEKQMSTIHARAAS